MAFVWLCKVHQVGAKVAVRPRRPAGERWALGGTPARSAARPPPARPRAAPRPGQAPPHGEAASGRGRAAAARQHPRLGWDPVPSRHIPPEPTPSHPFPSHLAGGPPGAGAAARAAPRGLPLPAGSERRRQRLGAGLRGGHPPGAVGWGGLLTGRRELGGGAGMPLGSRDSRSPCGDFPVAWKPSTRSWTEEKGKAGWEECGRGSRRNWLSLQGNGYLHCS